MKIKRYNCLILGLLLACGVFGQHEKLKNNYILPLKIEPALSGNFGEPRFRHFHTGIDFKTHHDGQSIVAISDGYVSRILVSPWGYGLALYVNHPEGYTSVYAHCSSFSPDIQKFVYDLQYENKSFRIDTVILPSTFPVKKGQIIALSGNTGQSEGPHLHFEIRETNNEMPVNTVNSIYNFRDTYSPEINYLVIYPLTNTTFINGKNEKLKLRVTKSGNSFVCNDKMPVVTGLIGIGVAYVDRMDNSQNRYGAKSVSLSVDNEMIYKSTLEKLSFDLQRAKNSMFDFEFLLKEELHVHKLFVEKGNKLDLFDLTVNDGMFAIEQGESSNLKVEIVDYNGNKSLLSFGLIGDTANYNTIIKTGYFVDCDSSFLYADASFRFEAYPQMLFHDYHCVIKKEERYKYSDVYLIGEDFIPINKDFKVSFFMDEKLLQYKDKLFVSREHDGDYSYLESEYVGNFISAQSSYFGKFYLWVDTTPPVITPVNLHDRGKLSGLNNISFKIADDLSGISGYKIFINDRWVLTQYDPRKKQIFYIVDDKFEKAMEYTVKVIVTDNLNNQQVLEIKGLK